MIPGASLLRYTHVKVLIPLLILRNGRVPCLDSMDNGDTVCSPGRSTAVHEQPVGLHYCVLYAPLGCTEGVGGSEVASQQLFTKKHGGGVEYLTAGFYGNQVKGVPFHSLPARPYLMF